VTSSRRHSPALPTRWTSEQLDFDRTEAVSAFRRERLEEPIETYAELFDDERAVMEDLLESTVDLTRLAEHATDILTDRDLKGAFRYLAGPPISEDDLKTLVDTASLSAKRLRGDPQLVQRILDTVRDALDRRRFPWVFEGREPSPAERDAAILASAALAAMRGVETRRRNQGKAAQEAAVRQALLDHGFHQVHIPGASAPTLSQAPQPGEFSSEVSLAGRKADLLVGLWDHRVMPIECKVSNSSLNSIKRLNNDAAAKAEGWIKDLGELQIVPVAVLSGVYSLQGLEDAQRRGLTLYWAHRLSDLTSWIARTRSDPTGRGA
jgi:hypothetical protein